MNEAMDILIDNSLFMMCLIFFTGVIAHKISIKLKLPEVVVYMITGIILGDSVLHLIDIDNSSMINQFVLIFGAAYIIYQGGKEIKLKNLKAVSITVGALATLGVLISTIVIAFFSSLIFHLDTITSLLVGAVIASTDPASLIPVFQKLKIKKTLKSALIAESAFNDAVGTVLVITILNVIANGSFSISNSITLLLKMIIIGAGVGLVIGWVLSYMIGSKKSILSEYSAIIGLIAAMSAYSVADAFGGSGFMSAFIAGLVCGNKKEFGLWVPQECFQVSTHFNEVIESLFKISIFILLGAHIDFSLLFNNLGGSLLLVLALVILARPLSVFICTSFDFKNKWSIKEKIFMSYVRETGVIPAAMSSVIVAMQIEGYEIISAVIVMAIIITIGIQSSTTMLLAKKLNIEE